MEPMLPDQSQVLEALTFMLVISAGKFAGCINRTPAANPDNLSTQTREIEVSGFVTVVPRGASVTYVLLTSGPAFRRLGWVRATELHGGRCRGQTAETAGRSKTSSEEL